MPPKKPCPVVIIPEEQSQSYHVDSEGKFIHGDLQIDDSGMKLSQGLQRYDDEEEENTPNQLKLQDLEMLELLGEGNSSVVHRAYHKSKKMYMAIKRINIFDKGRRHQIIKELHTLYTADCPYLISFYGAYFREGAISIALELMDAGSLADILSLAGCIGEHELAYFARQLLEGLFYLRKRHQVHRDIKPSNACVNTQAECKLTDFGITTQLDSTLEVCESFVGTAYYMSPERMLGNKYSYPSDVWSMGLTLLECAIGKFPYPNTGVYLEMMQSVVTGPVPTVPKDQFSELFQDFIQACLQKDADKRSTAEELLNHPWLKEYNTRSRSYMQEWIAGVLSKSKSKNKPKRLSSRAQHSHSQNHNNHTNQLSHQLQHTHLDE